MKLEWLIAFIVPLGGLIAGYGAFRQRLKSHEAQDNERFGLVMDLLHEVRSDIKDLLRKN